MILKLKSKVKNRTHTKIQTYKKLTNFHFKSFQVKIRDSKWKLSEVLRLMIKKYKTEW